MKIYIAHSREFDYESELYQPIRSCNDLPQSDIILPHEATYHNQQDRDFYKTLDLMIAEVSYPATGLGIELGWAYDDKTPAICIAKVDTKISGSIKTITNKIYYYNNPQELVEIIKQVIQ